MFGVEMSDSLGLDLFAGTGIVGLEAISRGAKKVTFIERHRGRFMELQSLVKDWGIHARTELYLGDALRFMKQISKESFDWVYVDPPYGGDLLKSSLQVLLERPLLKVGGRLILEFYEGDLDEMRESLGTSYGLLKDKSYGKSKLEIYGRIR